MPLEPRPGGRTRLSLNPVTTLLPQRTGCIVSQRRVPSVLEAPSPVAKARGMTAFQGSNRGWERAREAETKRFRKPLLYPLSYGGEPAGIAAESGTSRFFSQAPARSDAQRCTTAPDRARREDPSNRPRQLRIPDPRSAAHPHRGASRPRSRPARVQMCRMTAGRIRTKPPDK